MKLWRWLIEPRISWLQFVVVIFLVSAFDHAVGYR